MSFWYMIKVGLELLHSFQLRVVRAILISSIVKEEGRRKALREKIIREKSNEGSHWTFD